MKTLLHNPFALMALLIVATLASFLFLEVDGSPTLIAAGVIAMAVLKVVLIMAGYMELRLPHRPMGPVLAIWLAIAAAILATGFALAHTG